MVIADLQKNPVALQKLEPGLVRLHHLVDQPVMQEDWPNGPSLLLRFLLSFMLSACLVLKGVLFVAFAEHYHAKNNHDAEVPKCLRCEEAGEKVK